MKGVCDYAKNPTHHFPKNSWTQSMGVGWRQVREGKGGIHGDGKKLDFGW